jgi:hypothetical protein
MLFVAWANISPRVKRSQLRKLNLSFRKANIPAMDAGMKVMTKIAPLVKTSHFDMGSSLSHSSFSILGIISSENSNGVKIQSYGMALGNSTFYFLRKRREGKG